MKLTTIQKEFILDRFFRFNHENSAEWKTIAEKLIDGKEPIVAGEECIWSGGIGNFIDTEKIDEAYGCLKYKFNAGKFLDSPFFRDELKNEYIKKKEEYLNAKEVFEDLHVLQLNVSNRVVK